MNLFYKNILLFKNTQQLHLSCFLFKHMNTKEQGAQVMDNTIIRKIF
jgi:hypothetical protein